LGWTDRTAFLQAAAGLSLLGAPVYWWQGRQLRRRLPRLEEAPGDRRGRHGVGTPDFRLVGVGESPMAAVGLTCQSEGLIPQIAARLAQRAGRAVEWETAARSGATARDCRHELLPALGLRRADAVVVALGVNDTLALHGARRWRGDLGDLLDAVGQRLQPEIIVLAGVPPMQAFPALPLPLSGMLGLRSALLDSVARNLARHEDRLRHRPMVLDAKQDALFCIDGFHPNAEGHARWADQLAETLTPHAAGSS
jgi:lysophospholipase L1-like esterase